MNTSWKKLRFALVSTLAVFFVLSATVSASEPVPVDINVVEQSANDNGFLDAAANHFPNPIRVTNFRELAKKVCDALKKGECINKLTIAGHGSPGNISTGDGQGWEDGKHMNGNQDKWKPALRGLKGKFCSGAHILLWGCNVGACNKGAAKLHEMAKFFGVSVDAPTGKVYGDGTAEKGSELQCADPSSEDPPKHKAAPGECKKKETPPGFEVPSFPYPVTFPYFGTATAPTPISVQAIASVTFVPPAMVDNVFGPNASGTGQYEVVTENGDSYLHGNAVSDPAIVQQVVDGIIGDKLYDTLGLGSSSNGAVSFELVDGQRVTYSMSGDFQNVFSGDETETSMATTCTGQTLFRLLTDEPLPYTIFKGGLDPVTESDLFNDLLAASEMAWSGDTQGSLAALDQLIAETQALADSGLIPQNVADHIVVETGDLKDQYVLLHEGDDPDPVEIPIDGPPDDIGNPGTPPTR